MQTESVAFYTFRRKIGDSVYDSHLAVASDAEAEQFARTLGMQLVGKLQSARCAKCGNVLFEIGIESDWPEELNEN